jgi:hypothetical protein
MELTPEQLAFCASVLVTAVEQRQAAFRFENYNWDIINGTVRAADVTVLDWEGPDIDARLQHVRSADLHETFERFLAGPVKGLHDRLRARYIAAWALHDAGDIDAEDADYILQAHVLGEVIYG